MTPTVSTQNPNAQAGDGGTSGDHQICLVSISWHHYECIVVEPLYTHGCAVPWFYAEIGRFDFHRISLSSRASTTTLVPSRSHLHLFSPGILSAAQWVRSLISRSILLFSQPHFLTDVTAPFYHARMRLPNTSTLELEHFTKDIPRYAILSHTWEDEEILYDDARFSRKHLMSTKKTGISKIVDSCEKAAEDDHEYIWIDTCCIDKSSSA